MELDEFHVGYLAPCAPSHGYAVPRRRIGIGGVEVDLACAAGCQHCVRCREGLHMVCLLVENIGTVAAAIQQAELCLRDEIDGDVMLEHRNIWMRMQLFRQCMLYRRAGGIGYVYDAAMAMPPLSGKVIAGAGCIARKRDALVDQPVDGGFALFHHETGCAGVTQAGAGHQRVLDMRLDRVGIVERRGDASLGTTAGAVIKRPLGD